MNDGIFAVFIVCIFVILLVGTLTAIHNNKEIPFSSDLYGNVLTIKRNCSENVRHTIVKAISDNKLTYGEYDEIVSIYNEEHNRKILAELSK